VPGEGRSKSWLYKWKKRYEGTEPEWVEERSRRPQSTPTKTPDALERKSSSYAKRCRRVAWVRSVRMEFESLCVNTAVTRSPRVGRSLAFSSVRSRGDRPTICHRKSEMIAHVSGGTGQAVSTVSALAWVEGHG